MKGNHHFGRGQFLIAILIFVLHQSLVIFGCHLLVLYWTVIVVVFVVLAHSLNLVGLIPHSHYLLFGRNFIQQVVDLEFQCA